MPREWEHGTHSHPAARPTVGATARGCAQAACQNAPCDGEAALTV
jgi:hypothetical protein